MTKGNIKPDMKIGIKRRNTLQLQITGIVGLILLLACLILTANSLLSAHNYYGDYAALLEEGMVEYDSALPEGTLPPAIDPAVNYQNAAMKFSKQSVLAMVVIGLLAVGLTYWAVGKMLRPLKRLTNSVRAVDEQNLDQRVKPAGAQGEVLVLTESFNGMLDRLEDAFLIQKSFAANAAHELKTPLAVIKTSLQVLEMNPHPETSDYQEFMEDTEKSLERIIKTVEGLLSLANLAAVETDENVEVSALMKHAVQELSGKAKSAHVELSISCEEVKVIGNSSLLYRAFYNLIENAIKYNREGGQVAIAVKTNGDRAEIQIKDNGIGIEPEAVGHIFEPFFRADQSRSQKIPGSGLGLSVVKMILEKHGGEICVESQAGKGTQFVIFI
jgi:signal transduction histidine kinase